MAASNAPLIILERVGIQLELSATLKDDLIISRASRQICGLGGVMRINRTSCEAFRQLCKLGG